LHPENTGNRRAKSGLCFAAIACLFYSCAVSPHRPSAVPLVRDPTELIQRLIADSDSLRDARIRARVSLEIDGVRQKASSVAFFRQPDDLRMEISGPLGVSIMSAKFWGDSLRVYLPGENAFLQGPAASVLYKVTGVDLSYYNIPRVLLGLPTVEPSSRERVIGFHTEAEYYILELQHETWTRRIWINRSDLSQTREDIIDAYGKRRSQLRLEDHHFVFGCRFPRKVRISQGLNKIEFSVESHKVNIGLQDKMFDQNVPPGVKRLGMEQ
jgi:outer membrane lipoprotein-sorting protein